MTQNLNNPEEFEAWCNTLTPKEQAEYLASLAVRSDPVEYITTDRDMADRLDALVKKHGEVISVHSEDLGDFGIFGDEPEFEFLPDPDIPTCTDPECFMCD